MQRFHTSSVALPGSLCHHCRQSPRLRVTQPSVVRSFYRVRCDRQPARLKCSTAGRFPRVTAHASSGSEGSGLAQTATDSAEAAGGGLPEASATPSLAEQIQAAACEARVRLVLRAVSAHHEHMIRDALNFLSECAYQ